jgi:hypothetical protein
MARRVREPVAPLDPRSKYFTQGTGVLTYIDPETGDIEAIPNTATPPWGEDQWLGAAPVPSPIGGEDDNWLGDPPPDSQAEQAAQEFWIEDGRAWHGYQADLGVNPQNPGVPNLGPANVQDFQTGDSQIVRHVPAAEQGWGLDPAILVPRFPHVENTNPYWDSFAHRRMGDLEWVPQDMPFGDLTAQNVELYWRGYKRPSRLHGRLVDQPPAIPYSYQVPVGQAGPLDLIPVGDEAVY